MVDSHAFTVLVSHIGYAGVAERGERRVAAPPILGVVASPFQSWLIDARRKYCSCLQVEIMLNDVAIDSFDTHCRDHLCLCCSSYTD